MLAISTAWNYKPGGSLREMLTAIKETGVDTIELGYQLPAGPLEELIPLMDEMKIKISSIHNFCPIPFDGPTPRHITSYYRLSALDEKERQRAVKWTKSTIDTACRVSVGVVIIHAGMIELANDPSPDLFRMYLQDKHKDSEFRQLREEILRIRRGGRDPFIQSAIKSLEEIMPYARAKNVKIGLETRYYPLEVPNCEEIGEFLDLFHDQGLYYWHDTGHGEMNERLGITSQKDYLDRYGDRLIGFHIHGIKGRRDHLAPFEGDAYLNKVFPYMKAHHIKVIESHSCATPQQIKEAVKKLQG